MHEVRGLTTKFSCKYEEILDRSNNAQNHRSNQTIKDNRMQLNLQYQEINVSSINSPIKSQQSFI